MKIKLVTDCSANICRNIRMDIGYVPLKIVTREKEDVDTPELDVAQMLQELKAYKGPSRTSCPGVQDWLDAFGDSDMVLGAALTSGLSGCYNSAAVAAREYLEQRPDAKVFILDSLSTGPELELLMQEMGHRGGKVRLSHSANPDGAQALADRLRGAFPDADITITENRGLCCYYAEKGGMLVGFEGR